MSSEPLNPSLSSDLTPSKSQRKRDAQAILDLARKIVELSAGELRKLPLTNDVRRVAEGAQGITQRVARKREIQYLAKHLREVDREPIEQAMTELEAPGIAERERHQRLESWRERLLAENDQTLFKLLQSYPGADFQALRKLLLAARKEVGSEDMRARRSLFRSLAELDRSTTLPDPHG